MKLPNPSNEKEIQAFFHCGLCLRELPLGESPSNYQQIEAGWTSLGFQVWCKRHKCNIVHVSFEGMTHPANTTHKATEND